MGFCCGIQSLARAMASAQTLGWQVMRKQETAIKKLLGEQE